jgi:hypothetical protein
MTSDNLSGINIGATILTDEKAAVADLVEKIAQPDMHSVLFFCSSRYDLNKLGPELKQKFQCLLVGCTTAGEISSNGYQEGGIVGISFSMHNLKLHSHIIHPLSQFTLMDAQEIANLTRNELVLSEKFEKEKMFGLLLIDGLSILEEQVASYIYSQYEGVSIIGGSAGDDLQFNETKVYSDGKFLSNAASLTFFETTLPFTVFKTQHFKPTDKKMVITEADPPRRIVSEINAEPAALEYARILDVPISELSPAIFSKYPLMIRIADNWQVRSIQKVNKDNSLSFYCAIDTGLVLTLAEGVDIVTNLQSALNELTQSVPAPQLIIGCDCISRRLEIREKGLEQKIAELLKDKNFVGFNTYGEQFNSVHVNQTLAGVIIGSDNGPH